MKSTQKSLPSIECDLY